MRGDRKIGGMGGDVLMKKGVKRVWCPHLFVLNFFVYRTCKRRWRRGIVAVHAERVAVLLISTRSVSGGKKRQKNGGRRMGFLCPHSFVLVHFGRGGELDKLDPPSLMSEKTNREERAKEWRAKEWF